VVLDAQEPHVAPHADLEKKGKGEVADVLVHLPARAPLRVSMRTPGIAVDHVIVTVVPF
jgi:hypothetical protein